jgi:hypothetical protein
MARKPTTLRTIINKLVDRTNTDTQRIRITEQREEGLALRIDALEQETMNTGKALQKLNIRLDSELKKRDKSISEVQGIMREMIKQLKRLASAGKVKELEAMLNLYNPLKSNFMTREEVEQLVSERLSEITKNNK